MVGDDHGYCPASPIGVRFNQMGIHTHVMLTRHMWDAVLTSNYNTTQPIKNKSRDNIVFN